MMESPPLAFVDDQGADPNCTIHAVSKAITEGDTGIEHWATFLSVCGSLGVYVNQDRITKDLIGKHARVSASSHFSNICEDINI